MNRITTPRLLAVATALALTLAGCTTTTPADDGRLSIVASTDVYASIAEAVAGDRADVSAIIDNSATDPHSYEATARDRLALTQADIVIANGGGYDPFVDLLLGDSPRARVLSVVELSGLLPDDDHDGDHDHDDDHADTDDHDHADEDDHGHTHVEGFNEHVWYHLPTAKVLATALAVALGELDAGGAATYLANAEGFAASVDELLDRADALHEAAGHVHVVLTELAPQYLAEAIGAHNVTPEAFTSAVEAGFDVPPSALLQVLRLIENGEADLVLWNEQTSGHEIERVVDAARTAGVPVVSVTETLPAGHDYRDWMTHNLDAIAAALT